MFRSVVSAACVSSRAFAISNQAPTGDGVEPLIIDAADVSVAQHVVEGVPKVAVIQEFPLF